MKLKSWLLFMVLVIGGTGCSGGGESLAPGDSMEGALKDAQKNAEPIEGSGKGSMKSKTETAPVEKK